MERVAATIAERVRDLVFNHGDEIKEAWINDENNKCALSLSTTLTGAVSCPLVVVKLSFAKKTTDEASQQLDDPVQRLLDLAEQNGAKMTVVED